MTLHQTKDSSPAQNVPNTCDSKNTLHESIGVNLSRIFIRILMHLKNPRLHQTKKFLSTKVQFQDHFRLVRVSPLIADPPPLKLHQ